jgi:hypothetical protein
MSRRPNARRLLGVAVILLLGAGCAVAGVTKVKDGIEFTYYDPYAGSVNLAGQFNNWSMNANPLVMDQDGTWRVVLKLAPGTYEYKFVVNGSEWVADPDNPKVVGEYGNSQLVINDQGEPVTEAVGTPVSNTTANSRVRIDGWYRATYDMVSDVPSDPRWRLDRPKHEFYISVDPTVTPQVKGDATLRVSTGAGDIKEVSAEIYSGHLEFEGGPFNVAGYYNEERIQYNDPLELAGNIDLPGTIEEEHIAFGRGSQGLVLDAGHWGFDLDVSYSNTYDPDVYTIPTVYDTVFDNTDTDFLTGRVKRPVGPLTLGATYVSHRDNWWMPFTGTNESPALDEYIAQTGSTSDWFELANNESWLAFDAEWPDIAAGFGVHGEYARYGFKSVWDVGNREKVEGEDYSNGAIDVPAGDTEGWAGSLIISTPPEMPYTLWFQGTHRDIDSMGVGEEYTSFERPIWAGGPIREYNEVRYAGSPLIVGVYGPMPKRDEWSYELHGDLALGIFKTFVDYYHDTYAWTYAETPLLSGSDTWDGRSDRIAARFRADLRERLWVGIDAQWTEYDIDGGLWDVYDTLETIFRGGLGFTDEWGLLADIRRINYKDVPGSTATMGSVDENYYAPYVALVYSPRKNVEVRLGYGVDPTNYIDTPVEGRGNGRAIWREAYLQEFSSETVLDAEKALEDARVIGLMAVITF